MEFHQVPTIASINYITTANTADLIVKYRRAKTKFEKTNEHLWFNTQCKKNKIIPKYIQNSIKGNYRKPSVKYVIEKTKINMLNSEIKNLYCQRDNLASHIKVIHMELSKRLHNIELDIILSNSYIETKTITARMHANHVEKLHKLKKFQEKFMRSNTVISNEDFYPRLINNSEVKFNKKETDLLEKGLKYAPNLPNTRSDIDNLVVDLDIAIPQVANKHICTETIREEMKKNNTKNAEFNLIKSIKQKIMENDLIITKADKGNTVVITQQKEYNEKVEQFLSGDTFVVLKKDPTQKYNQIVNETLQTANSIFSEKDRILKPMNPSIPRLHGYYKLHKEDTPIRPVVSYTGAPAYNLAKKANVILKNAVKVELQHTIKSSIQLIDHIKDLVIPQDAILVSFDVKNLFPSIPIDDCKSAINEVLTESKLEPQKVIDLEHTVSVCLEQNYFTFNNNIYIQKKGLAMGSPLSPICADIYMHMFEKDILSHKGYKDNIIYWYRYVDDILCLWKGLTDEINNFLTHINSINPDIQFTVEIGGNQINFLDLNISIKDNRHEFQIYRKPTYTDITIHADSKHPVSHKHAAFHSMVHRLLSIPMSEESFQKELLTIKNIAKNNGYGIKVIDKILKSKEKSIVTKLLYKTQNIQVVDKKWVRIPFIGNISYKCSRLLPQEKIPAFYTPTNLKKCLAHKPNSDLLRKRSGVYELSCMDCHKKYIGQTGRSFDTRVKEHQRSWRLKKNDSSFAQHLLMENHNFDPKTNFKILQICNKGRKLNSLEALEINKTAYKNSDMLLNEQVELSKSPLLMYFK